MKASWESKIEEQKKEIKTLQAESTEYRNKFTQQKNKNQREMNRQKDFSKKLEQEIETLKTSVQDLEKEKKKLQKKIQHQQEMRSIDARTKKHLDTSKSTARSQNDLDLFSKRMTVKKSPKENPFFNRNNSHVSRKDNKLFSSTASLQPFNLFKTTKNLTSKNNGKFGDSSRQKSGKSPKGKFIRF